LLAFLIGTISGCTPDTEKEEANPPQRESCTLKVSACNNECHKAGALKECPRCCRTNGDSCDVGGNYSFYSCQNLD